MRYALFLISISLTFNLYANNLPKTLDKIRPSIVAIASFNPLGKPKTALLGTGFVVADGTLIATNAHVADHDILRKRNNKLTVFVGHGKKAKSRKATIVAIDDTHDLAILRISGPPLNPLSLSDQQIKEGENYAFTGFPIVNALGLYPVTHQGIISSISPIAVPARTTRELSPKQLKLLKNPYDVYLLNAVAYPGNSGSPVYDPNTGKVIAMINKVLVRKTKESVLSNPSAITYAISIKHLKSLLSRQIDS